MYDCEFCREAAHGESMFDHCAKGHKTRWRNPSKNDPWGFAENGGRRRVGYPHTGEDCPDYREGGKS